MGVPFRNLSAVSSECLEISGIKFIQELFVGEFPHMIGESRLDFFELFDKGFIEYVQAGAIWMDGHRGM